MGKKKSSRTSAAYDQRAMVGSGMAKEPMALYLAMSPLAKTIKRLSKGADAQDFFSDRLGVVRAIRSGVPIGVFLDLKSLLPFSDEQWSSFLNISLKSIQRYKGDGDHVFKPIHSEKILELTEVMASGLGVFDRSEAFYSWLQEPCIGLGGSRPFELMQDSYGKAMVMDTLNAIDHGIFA